MRKGKNKRRKGSMLPGVLITTAWKFHHQPYSPGCDHQMPTSIALSPHQTQRRKVLKHLSLPLSPLPPLTLWVGEKKTARNPSLPPLLSYFVCLPPISSLSLGGQLLLCVAPGDNLLIPPCCQFKKERVLPCSSREPSHIYMLNKYVCEE